MNATQGLVKSFKIDDAAGVLQYIAVVQGAADGSCKKPAAQNAAAFLGVTLEAQANQNKGVAVQMSGIARGKASGAITRGDRLRIHGVNGDIESCEAAVAAVTVGGAAVLHNVIGIAQETAADTQIFAFEIVKQSVITPVS